MCRDVRYNINDNFYNPIKKINQRYILIPALFTDVLARYASSFFAFYNRNHHWSCITNSQCLFIQPVVLFCSSLINAISVTRALNLGFTSNESWDMEQSSSGHAVEPEAWSCGRAVYAVVPWNHPQCVVTFCETAILGLLVHRYRQKIAYTHALLCWDKVDVQKM